MTKKTTHNKLKNTGILFELLTRQITSDILSGRESKAIDIIKEFFSNDSILSKEYELYNILLKNKFETENRAETLLNEVLKRREKISTKKLNEEKYKLVKAIKENYDINEFFKYRINDYKVFASIFKLFDTKEIEPADFVSSKFSIIEHITQKDIEKNIIISEIKEEYSKLDSDIRILSYKLLIEKFNQKYDFLSSDQKQLLEQYINNISNSTKLKDYINKKIPEIKVKIQNHSKKISDDVIKIKLEEVTNRLNRIASNGAIATDEDVLTLMRYYALCNELGEVNNENKINQMLNE